MNATHDTHDYEHVWPPYGVELAEPDTRTALATVHELNRRMAVVEHRLSLLETVEVTL